MSSTAEEPVPELVILPRPQISVVLSPDGQDVSIVCASIGADYNTVEHTEVLFPRECAEEIGKALIAIANRAE